VRKHIKRGQHFLTDKFENQMIEQNWRDFLFSASLTFFLKKDREKAIRLFSQQALCIFNTFFQ